MSMCVFIVFFFKQKTEYERRISDWSSDVCSSDLVAGVEILCCTRGDDLLAELATHFGGALADVGGQALHLDIGGGEILAEDLVHVDDLDPGLDGLRSEERRVGKECVSTCRYRWSSYL